MTKGWKIFWIICSVLAGAGIIFCIVGIVLGADFHDFRKSFYGSGAEQEIASFEMEGITALDLDVSATEVNLHPTDASNIKVDLYGRFHKHTTCIKDGETLKIDMHHRNHWFKFIKSHNKIDIYIPKTLKLKEADFDLNAVKLLSDGIDMENIDIDINAGMAEFTGISVDDHNYKIEMNLGTAKIGEQTFEALTMEQILDNQAEFQVDLDGNMSEVIIKEK